MENILQWVLAFTLISFFLLGVFMIGYTVDQGDRAEEKSRREKDEKGS